MLMNNKVLCFCTTIYNVNDISYENILIYYSLNVDLLSFCQVEKSRYIFFIKPENTRLVVCQKKTLSSLSYLFYFSSENNSLGPGWLNLGYDNPGLESSDFSSESYKRTLSIERLFHGTCARMILFSSCDASKRRTNEFSQRVGF